MKAQVGAMLLGCLHGMAFAGPPVPTASVPLAPAGKWQIDYGANECRLMRAFGDPAHSTTFQLTKIDPGTVLPPAFALASHSLRSLPGISTFKISAVDHAGTQPLYGSVLNVTPGTPAILYVPIAGALTDIVEADIVANRPTAITVSVGKTQVSLALGKMAQPISALDACMEDLMRNWGYDPAEQRQLKSRPIPTTPANTWVNYSDYPDQMVRENKSGGVTARLDVGPSGEIVGCHVMEAGGDPAFQQATCAVFRKNGHFRPAVDQDGKPVASYFPLKVMWRTSKL
ncbi:TonB-like protein [Sphingomonas sp. PP-CC-3G-468]|nr:TonB-like protein [Sphingomonas sp. PP-CC-3G-468]